MKQIGKLIIILIALVSSSCKNYGQTKSEKFLLFLNEYKKDDLANITTDNFVLEEKFSNYSYGRQEFLDTFLIQSKAINGTFKILKTISPTILLVEDNSDYSKYLKTKKLNWIMTFSITDSKISKIRVDSVPGYKTTMADFQSKQTLFQEWLKKKYPNENVVAMFKSTDGLLEKRLKEYSKN